jgi:hypothetical protein
MALFIVECRAGFPFFIPEFKFPDFFIFTGFALIADFVVATPLLTALIFLLEPGRSNLRLITICCNEASNDAGVAIDNVENMLTGRFCAITGFFAGTFPFAGTPVFVGTPVFAETFPFVETLAFVGTPVFAETLAFAGTLVFVVNDVRVEDD